MTLEELEQARPAKISVSEAAAIMQIHPQALRIGLQRGQFNFGVAIKRKRWVYWICTERFLAYMKALDLTAFQEAKR